MSICSENSENCIRRNAVQIAIPTKLQYDYIYQSILPPSLPQAALDQSAIAVATSDPSSHQADLQQGLNKILVTASGRV